MRRRDGWLVAAALIGWPGCGGPAESAPPAGLASLAEDAPAAAPAPVWSEPVDVPLDAIGDGQEVTLTLPPGRAALRLSPTPSLDDDTRCYRLDHVTIGATDWLSSAPGCAGCGLSLTRRPTEGFWVLPGDDVARTATVGFALTDCLTSDGRSAGKLAQQGTPLRWQVLAPPALPADAVLEVRIGLTRGVAVLDGDDGGLSLWREVLASVRASFAAAGVRVVVSRLTELPADDTREVTSQAGDEDDLARRASEATALLGAGAGEQYLPVVVVPCLVRRDLLSGHDVPVSGFTPRIPGGARLDGRAEAVFLAGTCTPDDEPPDAARLARVMAHEVGHYLGLAHSDSPAGEPLADGQPDLMDSNVVYRPTTRPWSPRQREALRLHPLLR